VDVSWLYVVFRKEAWLVTWVVAVGVPAKGVTYKILSFLSCHQTGKQGGKAKPLKAPKVGVQLEDEVVACRIATGTEYLPIDRSDHHDKVSPPGIFSCLRVLYKSVGFTM